MIYLLEDDNNIRKLIAYSLKSEGMETLDFSTPSSFWAAFRKEKPSLILLDIMLPEEDGISILKKIRRQKDTSSIPIIMITAKDTEFDMVSGLDSGADDYITKPFGMRNLIARVKAVLRRYENSLSTIPNSREEDINLTEDKNKKMSLKKIKFAEIVMDLIKHNVFIGKKQIFLTIKEFDLLALLIQNKEEVLTRTTLLNSIWNIDADVESRTVDVHIKTLRQKLGECGDYIETIRGLGYKISKKNK